MMNYPKQTNKYLAQEVVDQVSICYQCEEDLPRVEGGSRSAQ